MSIMGHDEFNRRRAQVAMIHERRANFPSSRYDYRRLPVAGSAAFDGKQGRLGDIIAFAGLAIGFGTVTYMLGRWAAFAYFGH